MERKMEQDVLRKLKRRRRRRLWRRLVSMMMCVVVFCTTYALILPAITKETEAFCGFEAHVHTGACYPKRGDLICEFAQTEIHIHTEDCHPVTEETPSCGLEEIEAHVHTDACVLLDEKVLCCTLKEGEGHTHSDTCAPLLEQTLSCKKVETEGHIHTDACQRKEEKTLSCTAAEAEGHTHTDACGLHEVKTLSCTAAESEGHTHTDACGLHEVKTLTCDTAETAGHTHTDACSRTETVLICDLAETEEHAHGDGCYTEVVSNVCGMEEVAGHSHTDACYTVTVSYGCNREEAAGHTHTDACYTVTTTYDCGLEEAAGHTHTDACYTVTTGYDCGLEEAAGHTHTDACYTVTTTYGCGLEEAEAHAHTDECYTITTIYGCGLEEAEAHTHGDACYTAAYSCGLKETEGHAHSDACYRTVYDCGQEAAAHVHTEACYAPAPGLVCTLEENGEHTHGVSCYTGSPVCGLEEHEHTLECYSDPTADLEGPSYWESTLPGSLTGNYAEDLLAVARSQLGYTESTRNYIVDDSGEIKGYTRYGAWYGFPHGDWCAMFVSFCLHYAKVDVMPIESSCANWVDNLRSAGMYAPAAGYTPQSGDIIFFDWNADTRPDHVGIVAKYFPAEENDAPRIQAIEGNCNNTVCYTTYNQADPDILGYGILPVQEIAPTEIPELPAVSDMIAKIEQLPSADEIDRVVVEYEEAGDLLGKEAYLLEISEQAAELYYQYTQLTESQQSMVTNADKLLALEYLWSDPVIPNAGIPDSPLAIANIIMQAADEAEMVATPARFKLMRLTAPSPRVTGVTGTVDMAPLIDAVTVYHKQNGGWVKVESGGTITQGEDLKFTIDYTVDGEVLSDTKNTLIYKIPSNITHVVSSSGSVYNDSKEEVGSFTIDANTGYISITFLDTFVEDNELNKSIKGSISFYATVENITTEEDSSDDIVFSDEVKIELEVVEKEETVGDLDVEKSITQVNGTELSYQIIITSKTGTFDKVVLNDQLSGGIFVRESSVTVKDKTGKTVTPTIASDSTSSNFTLTLPQMKAGDTYILTYTAELKGNLSGITTTQNKAIVNSKKNTGLPISDFAEVNHTFRFMDKSGKLQEDGSIQWTIVINQDKADISGWYLMDVMQQPDGTQAEFKGPVTITDSTGYSVQVTLPFVFPEGCKDTYTITYTTTHEQVSGGNNVGNWVGLFYGGDAGAFEDTEWVGIGTNYPVTKQGELLPVDPQTGNFLIKWTITLDTSNGPLPAGAYIQDKLDSEQYMTYDQMMQMIQNVLAAIEPYDLTLKNVAGVDTETGTRIYYNEMVQAGNSKTYKRFYVYFNEAIPENIKFTFSFEATAETVPSRGYFQNRVNINGTAEFTAKVEYISDVPTISKYGVSPNNGFKLHPNDTDINYDDLYEIEGQKTVWWRLRLDIPEGYSDAIIVKDTLPEGMALVGTIAQPWGSSEQQQTVYPNENGYGLFNWANYYYLDMQVVEGTDGKQTVTYTVREETVRVLSAEHTSQKCIDLYVVCAFKDDFNWGDSDDLVIQEPFTNTVNVESPDGDKFDTDSHTFTVNYDKNDEVVSKTGALNQLNELEYAVVLNEKARNLDPDESTIKVQDVLTYVSPEACPIRLYLKPNSVEVYDYTGGVKGDLITTTKYTYKETSAGEGDITYTHTLDLVLPDSKAMLLEYVYNVDGEYNENYSYDMLNTCIITGIASGTVSDDVNIEIKVYDTNAEANVDGIYVRKVDSGNNKLYLPGAVFNLYTWNNQTKQYERVKHPNTNGSEESHYAFTTDKDGNLLLNNDTVEAVAYNAAYYITEVKSPSGYFRDPDPYYFYIYSADTEQNPYNFPTGFTGDKLTNGALVYYYNEAATTEIVIHKKWLDHNNNPITVTADQVKSVSFELWQRLDGDENSDKLYGTYTVTPDETGFWEAIITDLPKGIVDPDDGTKGNLYQYYIKEVSVPGYTVAAYENNEGINTGTITMTNRKNAGYELPETGGAGTNLYTMAGLLLMLTSAAYLMYSNRPRRREEF